MTATGRSLSPCLLKCPRSSFILSLKLMLSPDASSEMMLEGVTVHEGCGQVKVVLSAQLPESQNSFHLAHTTHIYTKYTTYEHVVYITIAILYF